MTLKTARPTWTDFENDVTFYIVQLLDCSNGDAQGIVEANDDILVDHWNKDEQPAVCAQAIIDEHSENAGH